MANALALPMLGVYKKHTNLQNVDFNERNRGQLSPRSGFVQPVVSAQTSAQIAQELINQGYLVKVIAPFPNRPAGKLFEGYRRQFVLKEMEDHNYTLLRCFSKFSNHSSLISRFLENFSFGIVSGLITKHLTESLIYIANQLKAVGENFRVTGVTLCAANRIEIGKNVAIGANTTIIDTDFHPLDPVTRRIDPQNSEPEPISIEDDVFVGMNCIILKSVRIGKSSVIGAGCVVTKDVPAGAIAAVNPAGLCGK